jgi:hypothetical protein
LGAVVSDARGAASWDAKRAEPSLDEIRARADAVVDNARAKFGSLVDDSRGGTVELARDVLSVLAECERLRERGQAAYAEGYDQAHDDVWDAPVCSACGENHDADESAMCEHAEVVSFREWVEAASRLREQLDVARQALENIAHPPEYGYADDLVRVARAALGVEGRDE